MGPLKSRAMLSGRGKPLPYETIPFLHKAMSSYEQVRTFGRFPSDSGWSPGRKGTALRSPSLRSKLPR